MRRWEMNLRDLDQDTLFRLFDTLDSDALINLHKTDKSLKQSVETYLSQTSHLFPRVTQGDSAETLQLVDYFFRPSQNNSLYKIYQNYEDLSDKDSQSFKTSAFLFVCFAMVTDDVSALNAQKLNSAVEWAKKQGYTQANLSLEFIKQICTVDKNSDSNIRLPSNCYINSAGFDFSNTKIKLSSNNDSAIVANFDNVKFSVDTFSGLGGVSINTATFTNSNFAEISTLNEQLEYRWGEFLNSTKLFQINTPFNINHIVSSLDHYDRILGQGSTNNFDGYHRVIANIFEHLGKQIEDAQLSDETLLSITKAIKSTNLYHRLISSQNHYLSKIRNATNNTKHDHYARVAEPVISASSQLAQALHVNSAGFIVADKKTQFALLDTFSLSEILYNSQAKVDMKTSKLFGSSFATKPININNPIIKEYLDDPYILYALLAENNSATNALKFIKYFLRPIQYFLRPSETSELYQKVKLHASDSMQSFILYALVTDDIRSIDAEKLNQAINSLGPKESNIKSQLSVMLKLMSSFNHNELNLQYFDDHNFQEISPLLSRLNLSGIQTTNVNLTHTAINADIPGMIFVNSNFEESDCRHLNFTGTQFVGADDETVGSDSLDDINLTNRLPNKFNTSSNLSGINLSSGSGERSVFENVDLEKARFNASTLPDVSIQGCYAVGADFTAVDAPNAVLQDNNFSSAIFFRTNMPGAHLSHSTFYKATLRGCIADHSICIDTDFKGADMRDIDLRYSILIGAKFKDTLMNNGTKLDGAQFFDRSFSLGELSQACSKLLDKYSDHQEKNILAKAIVQDFAVAIKELGKNPDYQPSEKEIDAAAVLINAIAKDFDKNIEGKKKSVTTATFFGKHGGEMDSKSLSTQLKNSLAEFITSRSHAPMPGKKID